MKYKCARISSVFNHEQFSVIGEHGEVSARLLAKLSYLAKDALDLPVVGDYVSVEYLDQNTLAIIKEVLPRQTVLKRKTVDKRTAYQAIAANIDLGFIVMALDQDFNLNRIERYMVMLKESKIQPMLLLSKSDLLETAERDLILDKIKERMPNLETVIFSNVIQDGLDKIKDLLEAGKTYCLLGSSGVGKTTLTNQLLQEELYATQEIREHDGKGRHTTSRRQLIALANGAFIIDTPGMRELGQIDVQAGLDETFDDIAALASECKFNDCSHASEIGCAVLKALKENVLSKDKYKNYIKVCKEGEFNQLSYLDKKRKDKSFGKMIKNTMSFKKRYKGH